MVWLFASDGSTQVDPLRARFGSSGIQEGVCRSCSKSPRHCSRVAEVPKLEQHDWRMIWRIPAVGAGVVLIAFAFFFRDETASGSSDDSGDGGT